MKRNRITNSEAIKNLIINGESISPEINNFTTLKINTKRFKSVYIDNINTNNVNM